MASQRQRNPIAGCYSTAPPTRNHARSREGEICIARVEATIAIDAATRTVELPDDAAKALTKAKLRKQFDALAFTHQREHVRAITEAKKPETRAARSAAMLEKLRE